MKKRLSWVDNLRGVGIVLVIWGHTNVPLPIEHIIYSFHMPLFFMISGYLYRKKDNIRKVIEGKINGLIIPYFIFAIPSFFLAVLKGDGLVESLKNLLYLNGLIGWNAPLWFLLVLFFVSVIFALIDHWNISLDLMGGIAFVLGFFISNTGIYFMGLDKIIYGLLFYYFGLQINKLMKGKFYQKNSYLLLVASLVLNIIFGFFLNPRISIYRNELGNYFFFVIAALFGSLALFIVVTKWVKWPKLIEFYGKNSIVIIGTHYFFLYGFRLVEKVFHTDILVSRDSLLISILELIVILIGTIPIVFIYNRLIKSIIKINLEQLA